MARAHIQVCLLRAHTYRSVQTIAIAIEVCAHTQVLACTQTRPARSACRYVRLNALNVLHVPRPLFIFRGHIFSQSSTSVPIHITAASQLTSNQTPNSLLTPNLRIKIHPRITKLKVYTQNFSNPVNQINLSCFRFFLLFS